MFTTLIVQPIFNLLVLIYAVLPGHNFGLSIIIFTIIIRLLLWPLVKKQLHQAKLMRKIQPELKRIAKETKGNRQKQSQMQMELYKEREINPFASFLPLLIQLPIFLSLFIVLKAIVKPGEIAHIVYPFVSHLAPIAEIIKNNAAFHPTLFGAINLTQASPLLAALAALAQFVQTKQITPKHTPGDAQAQMMMGMVYVFPAITFFIGLSLPSALPLYWFTASAIAVLQQYLVLKRDVRELEDGTPTPVSTPAPATSQLAHTKHKKKRKKS